MQGYHLFEYATFRLIPRVERGEFINIGSILYCSGEQFLQCLFHWDERRVTALFPEVDLANIQNYCHAIEHVCAGDQKGGSIAALSMAERFRWLTATRSTVIQAAPVHPGYTQDAQATLHRIHTALVKTA